MGEHTQTAQDDGLQGNEQIEKAILALQKDPTEEGLAHALTVIRRRMKVGGQWIVAVEPSLDCSQLKLATVKTENGDLWWMAFTSFEEEMHGAEQVKSTFLADIDQLFTAALTVPEVKGILLNPWNRTIMLDKTLIRIIKPE